MASLDVDSDIAVRVTSINRLSSSLQSKVLRLLDLSYYAEDQTIGSKRKRAAQSTSSSMACAISTYASKITKVRIANVGQGSCNLLYTGGSIHTVYDLGYGKGKQTGTIEDDLSKEISQASRIIISHWDLDHYRYVIHSPGRILAVHKQFIAPIFGSHRGPVVRKVVAGFSNQNLYLVDVGQYARNPWTSVGNTVINLNLYTTTKLIGKNKNDVGAITLSILDYNCNRMFLFPGDASYSVIPSAQKLNLKYLVATHHGSTRNIGNVPQAAH